MRVCGWVVRDPVLKNDKCCVGVSHNSLRQRETWNDAGFGSLCFYFSVSLSELSTVLNQKVRVKNE